MWADSTGTLGVSILALGLLTVGLAGPAAGANHQLLVDNDLQECPDAGFTSIQAAVDAAPKGATVTVCEGTYEEVVRVDVPNLVLTGPGKRQDNPVDPVVDSQTATANHVPALQLAADGVDVRQINVVRIVDDPRVAGSGHTKALGVNVDRSGGQASPAATEVQGINVRLFDETGQEDFGNAVWVSDVNALGGERAAVDVEFEGSRATTNVSVNDARGGFGGAAVGVFQKSSEVSVLVDNAELTDSPRGVHVAGGAPSVDVEASQVASNGVGLVNDGTTQVVAERNWWGSPLGPMHESNAFTATGQTGATVSGDVDVEPWCANPGCDVSLVRSP